MVTTKPDTKAQRPPPHMQESTDAFEAESDSELSTTDTAVDSATGKSDTQSDLDAANKKVKVMEKLLKRKTKVGEVELDPEIGTPLYLLNQG